MGRFVDRLMDRTVSMLYEDMMKAL